jgi:hypothetical protein
VGRWLRDNLRFVQAIHQGQAALKSRLAAWRESRAAQKTRQGEGAGVNTTQQDATAQPASDATAQPAQQQAAPTDELGAANMIYREPSDDTWRDAWRVTEKLLATMRVETEARGATFVVATLSNGIQVYPDASAREAFARRLGVADLFYAERRFRDLGEREGFPVLNLAPDLQSYADRNKVFLHGFAPQPGNGHWNETGHAVAGELLAQKLCELLAR